MGGSTIFCSMEIVQGCFQQSIDVTNWWKTAFATLYWRPIYSKAVWNGSSHIFMEVPYCLHWGHNRIQLFRRRSSTISPWQSFDSVRTFWFVQVPNSLPLNCASNMSSLQRHFDWQTHLCNKHWTSQYPNRPVWKLGKPRHVLPESRCGSTAHRLQDVC